MKRYLFILWLLISCQMSYSQFIVNECEDTYGKSYASAICKSFFDEAELYISCHLNQGRKIFYMSFYFDDLCMDNNQKVVISYKIGENFSRYTFTISDNTKNYGTYDGSYNFNTVDPSRQGIYIAGIKNYDKFWQDLKAASRMYVNIGETNECDEIEVVFNMEGSTKAYNYLKDHPSQPTVIHYHK